MIIERYSAEGHHERYAEMAREIAREMTGRWISGGPDLPLTLPAPGRHPADSWPSRWPGAKGHSSKAAHRPSAANSSTHRSRQREVSGPR